MSTPLTTAEAQRAVDLLASRPLVRLVAEIDDNGAIPPRRMASTLHDLSTHHLRGALETARAHGLLRNVPGAGLELSYAGRQLADLYDAIARWARRHAVPTPLCEFTSRIGCVLELLEPSLTTGAHVAGADEGLPRLRSLLIQWLVDNPQVARAAEPEQAA